MHSSKDSPPGRIIGDKLTEKCSPIPEAPLTSQLSIETEPTVHNKASDLSLAHTDGQGQTAEEIAYSQRFALRSLPAWIRSVDEPEEDGDKATANDSLLPSQPNDACVAQHNHSPYSSSKPKPNHTTNNGLFVEDSPMVNRESRWVTFSRAIQYPRPPGREEQHVTSEWLNENHGDYSQPWRGKHLEGDSPEYPLHSGGRREIWITRFRNTLLRSPIVPLILRMTVWCFSLSALALGGSIQQMANQGTHPQGPSALMAIIVDAVAMVYLLYITFDEYTSKPLGLRSPSAKARLLLLDIFFIVFDSANLSLAFASLSEVTGSCTEAEVNQTIDPRNDGICTRQKALASVLLVALLAWLMTFSISVLRLVERVTQ
ncbi:hypothetical protein DTO013E5_904 [Penicillium roqueforti]|uniref:Genomic scaffold, ProqFM164S01 n=1 Tax=Penicillium roqueforti (strain FM164) TaxID=1365484 RepID=W6Q3B3_PENRF|nr:uncharacterized protein LCP9604111_2070 [Penicillium roqueforti]CDM28664.1 unnamed protein product [Penicillium roqueforti FM164]KAF9252074.1 hypothetical protein LCP9604111_2070 [Penicillium roqueforti]KAI1837343.1 hypothetical protein CBS147337_1626 [Penicillium roqueforti]KAI2687781.1 hypothetical protein LCP963914a_3299 [Penicillium roqueforti]KAI2689851.1 hypothetical protein CBS147355_302 [Penicillium roqueforti]